MRWRIRQQSEACMGQVVELHCWGSYAGLTCDSALLRWAAGQAVELSCLAELLGWAAADGGIFSKRWSAGLSCEY